MIYVNMFDMTDYEDQPLGYLLYRAMTALRPQVTAELGRSGSGCRSSCACGFCRRSRGSPAPSWPVPRMCLRKR
ncbi:marR-family protein transcriptional regulator [Mycobacterium xenopi 3993]|nr:marR-family protein transcriptional regulator [Mycobacterium xenopi 3993]